MNKTRRSLRTFPEGCVLWRQSPEFRAIASATAKRNLLRFRNAPKCGARRKYDGQPCQQVAKANGRCHLHGGRTPKGDNWHVTQWPGKEAPNANEKLEAKLAAMAKGQRLRRREVAALSSEERVAYDQWRRTHKPGSAAERQRARSERHQAADMKRRLAKPRRVAPTELDEKIQILELELAAQRARARELQQITRQNARPPIDIFS